MSNFLEDYSPFQAGLGRFAIMVRIPLGEDRGWIELHIDGRAVLFSVDYPDEPIFQFNAEDGQMLAALASELGGMAEAWEELKKQSPEHINPAKITGNKYDHQGGEEEEPSEATHSPRKRSPSPLPDQPKLVGMGAPKVATAGSP